MSEPEYSTQLAIQRTVMAADRTLMAWIRTALSMISFGFTIYKIIEGMEKTGGSTGFEMNGHRAGLILCGLGVACIVVGMIEYYNTIRDVKAHSHLLHRRYSMIIAFLMLLFGVTIFISILTHFA